MNGEVAGQRKFLHTFGLARNIRAVCGVYIGRVGEHSAAGGAVPFRSRGDLVFWVGRGRARSSKPKGLWTVVVQRA